MKALCVPFDPKPATTTAAGATATAPAASLPTQILTGLPTTTPQRERSRQRFSTDSTKLQWKVKVVAGSFAAAVAGPSGRIWFFGMPLPHICISESK